MATSLGIPVNLGDDPPILEDKKRFEHLLCCAGTGYGKTTFFTRLIKDTGERGTIVIDPAGELAEAALALHPDAHYITKTSREFCFNPLNRDYLNHSEISNELTEVINLATYIVNPKQMKQTALMNRLLRNSLRVGIKNLKDFVDLLEYKAVRKLIDDRFWQNFDSHENRERRDSAKRIADRLSFFVDDINLYPMFDGKFNFDVKKIAKNKEVVIFDLRGLDAFLTSFIGALIVNYVKSYYRYISIKIPKEDRPELYVYIDEVHQFVPDSDDYTKFLVESRKHNISLNLSFHSFDQIGHSLTSMLWSSCYSKCFLGGSYLDLEYFCKAANYDRPELEEFEGLMVLGTKPHHVMLYPPIELPAIPATQYNFLKPNWIPLS